MGLQTLFGQWIQKCDYSEDIDEEDYHLLMCKFGGGPAWSHNTCSVWSECLGSLSIHHQREPRYQYSETDNRPDIVLFESETGVSIELDASPAHPWSKDNLNKAACEEGYAAKNQEEKKCKKYNNERLPGGVSPTFTPLVLEHFGHIGSQPLKISCLN